jgi:hypothetical protein
MLGFVFPLGNTAGLMLRLSFMEHRRNQQSAVARVCLLGLLVCLLAALSQNAGAQTTWRETYEGPLPSWVLSGGDASGRFEIQERTSNVFHDGTACEHLAVQAGRGTSVYVSHEVPRARVIDELIPTIWLRSDRPGLRLYALVVFPRTRNPQTGEVHWTLLPGSAYTQVGGWQELGFDQPLPQLVEYHVREVRAATRRDLDAREAYIEALVLNVYGGEGRTELWIDDAQITGVHSLASTATTARPEPAEEGVAAGDRRPAAPRQARLEGTTLVVDGRPFFLRMIEHQGEPLSFLAQLGFNAVHLDRLPSPEVCREAEEAGIWLVVPGPEPVGGEGLAPLAGGLPPVPDSFGPVLAFDLGNPLTQRDVERVKRQAEQLRRADEIRRPLVGSPVDATRTISRSLDVVHCDLAPLGTRLELADFRRLLKEKTWHARPGMPLWAAVQTEWSIQLEEQAGLLAGGSAFRRAIPVEQIRLVSFSALAAGARGLFFRSSRRLDGADREAESRRAALELVNLELSLIEPWAAGGETAETAAAATGPISAAMLEGDRTRLLLPAWSGSGAQYVPGQAAENAVSLVAPGVPETFTAYEVSPAGVHLVRHQRKVAGGMLVSLDELGVASIVLLSQDPAAMAEMKQRAGRSSGRATRLAMGILAERIAGVEAVDRRMSMVGRPYRHAGAWLAAARAGLETAERELASRRPEQAWLTVERAMRPLRLIERAHWETAARSLNSAVESPLAVRFETLPDHWELVRSLSSKRQGANALVAGDFEALDVMRAAGWRHFSHPQQGWEASAQLSEDRPRSGERSLELSVTRTRGEVETGSVESPPLWITSPPVPVRAGQVLLIQGWIRIDSPIQGSVDGLLIVDSLGGDSLGERFRQTDGWQDFSLIRAAPTDGDVTLTLVMTGDGRAWIDDLTIEVLAPNVR